VRLGVDKWAVSRDFLPIVMTFAAVLHGVIFGRMGAEWVQRQGGSDFSGKRHRGDPGPFYRPTR
jgi:hypothetical protein